MLDLEMSGLDPDNERIIEVACFVVEAEPSLFAAGCAATSRYLLEVASSARQQAEHRYQKGFYNDIKDRLICVLRGH